MKTFAPKFGQNLKIISVVIGGMEENGKFTYFFVNSSNLDVTFPYMEVSYK